jgi:hypothetical protein
MRLGKQIMARVIGLTVELIDKDTGKAHTHTFDDEVPAAKELFVPGQELTLSYARKEGSKTLKTADPKAADEFRNDALTHSDKTEGQLEDEAKSKKTFTAAKEEAAKAEAKK